MMRKQKGWPQCSCACSTPTAHGVKQKEGLGGDLQAVHIHLSTHLSTHTCHVYRSTFQICIFTSETFMPPFKRYYSMYYPYLGHCPKAFEGQGQD